MTTNTQELVFPPMLDCPSQQKDHLELMMKEFDTIFSYHKLQDLPVRDLPFQTMMVNAKTKAKLARDQVVKSDEQLWSKLEDIMMRRMRVNSQIVDRGIVQELPRELLAEREKLTAEYANRCLTVQKAHVNAILHLFRKIPGICDMDWGPKKGPADEILKKRTIIRQLLQKVKANVEKCLKEIQTT
eukprot:m.35195 g.35195  ORF g.35195 m.35195 type:complete len:186 (+) comp17099_c0_seq3:344-901(+)